MKTIDIKKEILSADKWQRITVDYVNYPNVCDPEGYQEPIEVLHIGNDITLDVSSGYISLSRLHYNEEGKPELGDKAEELAEFETGIEITSEEIANMTVLEFMIKIAQSKEGAE
ncbi:hypothetical protein [Bacillus velezensis]|uniref:hypothetical protein n=1 Tax=Bacillus velezensis TaxID=492670 RepID=UPI001451FD70|nr:hypothetical protein [Bacillus velezensis]QJC91994.1 hypothetical protein HC661_11770 [Bacillus velezensis]